MSWFPVSLPPNFVTSDTSRRQAIAVIGSGIILGGLNVGSAEEKNGVPYRPLGDTGETVSCIGMGGFHLGKKDLGEDDAVKLIHSGIDQGINFMDNSWDYNKGESERRMGKALKQADYRKRAFLMTKIDGRTREVANRQIEESLMRLQTDHVDLLQFHEVIRYDDPDRIFSEGGAIEAFLDAKKSGKTRYIGFTGHKDPHIHLYMLQVADKHGFKFDTVQMPVNVMDAHYRSFGNMVLPELNKRKVAVLAMKSLGDAVILKSNLVSAMECLHYSLHQPASVVITGIDKPEYLDQAIKAARTYRQTSVEQMEAILAKTKPAAATGKWELFKTSSHFDSTARNPDWLGAESPHVKAFAPPPE